MIGKQISHYVIKKKIGQGGMGAVYLAEDTNLKRSVAIKFYINRAQLNPEEKKRFVQEAQAAARLDHPNICTVYEFGDSNGQSFIAMTYIDGETLKQRINKRTLDISESISIIIQASKGLCEAHKAGIVHRDIKSSNIMITANNLVKILDFGVAKILEAPDITRKGSTLGTLAYMSPEQVEGKRVDNRTDIWSIGVLLYEMLCGKRPFHGQEFEIMREIVNKPPVAASQLNSFVPAALDEIISKCLQKDPNQRYQDLSELISDLNTVATDMATKVYKKHDDSDSKTVVINALRETAEKERKRTRNLMIGFSAVLLILATFFWYMFSADSGDSNGDVDRYLVESADLARTSMLAAKKKAIISGGESLPEFTHGIAREDSAKTFFDNQDYQMSLNAYNSATEYFQLSADKASGNTNLLKTLAQNYRRQVKELKAKVRSTARRSSDYKKAQSLEDEADRKMSLEDYSGASSLLRESINILKPLTTPPKPVAQSQTSRRTTPPRETQKKPQETTIKQPQTKPQESDPAESTNKIAENQRTEAIALQQTLDRKYTQLDDSYENISAYSIGQGKRKEAAKFIEEGNFTNATAALLLAESLYEQALVERKNQTEAISRLIENYRSAIQNENLQQMQRLYPSISEADRQSWGQFFKAAESVKVSTQNSPIRFLARQVTCRVNVDLNYTIRGQSSAQQPVWNIDFIEKNGRWVIGQIN